MSTASEIMTSSVKVTAPHHYLEEVIHTLIENNFVGMPVVNENYRVVGIISAVEIEKYYHKTHVIPLTDFYGWINPHQDIKDYIKLEKGVNLLFKTRVEKVMKKNVITVTTETPVESIANLMRKHKIIRVPVIDENKQLQGIITRSNILKYIAAEMIAIKASSSSQAETKLPEL